MAKKRTKTALAKSIAQEKLEEQVRSWFAEGFTESEILEALISQGKKDPRELVSKALVSFHEAGEADSAIVKGWALSAMSFCYRKLIQTGDFGTAARVAKQMADLGSK